MEDIPDEPLGRNAILAAFLNADSDTRREWALEAINSNYDRQERFDLTCLAHDAGWISNTDYYWLISENRA